MPPLKLGFFVRDPLGATILMTAVTILLAIILFCVTATITMVVRW